MKPPAIFHLMDTADFDNFLPKTWKLGIFSDSGAISMLRKIEQYILRWEI